MNKKIDNQIQQTLHRLRKLKTRKTEAQRIRRAAAKAHPRRRGGRPKIDENLLKQIKLDALMGKPIADVALKYGVSVSTIYRYGIKRKELEREIDSIAE